MSFVAINVCLISQAFDLAALPLSNSLCPCADPNGTWDSSVSYRLASVTEKKLKRGNGYAHCTVVQLCIRAFDLTEVRRTVQEAWRKHRPGMEDRKESLELFRVATGPVFDKLSDGTEVHLPNICITRSDALMALHEDLMAALKPFMVTLGSIEVGKSSFHKHFPVTSTTSVKWLVDFPTSYAHENYNPHITLGSSPMAATEKLVAFQKTHVPLRECRLVVSEMGNFCSCFEIVE